MQVELEPVPLHLDPPTAQEFHTDLQQLFTAGEAHSSQRAHGSKGCFAGLPLCLSMSPAHAHPCDRL